MNRADTPVNIGVIGSGRGSNFEAIAKAIRSGKLPARICCVLSNVAEAPILGKAAAMGIPAEFVDPAPFKTKLDGAAEIRAIERLRHYRAEIVALAGFMMIVRRRLLEAYPRRIVNIHPSLLPAFPGLEAWKQALDAGAKETGCTVHYVDEGTDTGPIILQKKAPVLPGDTPETLHARIQSREHEAYPEALALVIAALRSGAM